MQTQLIRVARNAAHILTTIICKMSVVTREFTYGIDEKLYTSESERDKLKNKFNTFMKKVD